MDQKNQVVIEATSVTYYSQNDEAAMFEWLDKIPSVNEYFGQGLTIYIKLDESLLDEFQIRDLFALYYRYEINLKELSNLKKTRFFDYLNDPEMYWYEDLFK